VSQGNTVLELHMREVKRYNLLTDEQVVALAARIKGGDPADAERAKQELVLGNLRWAKSCADKVFFRLSALIRVSIGWEDLLQEAYAGMIRSAETFDPAKGTFTSYATRQIIQSMKGYIRSHAFTIRLAQDVADVRHRIVAAREALAEAGNARPTDDEVVAKAEQLTPDLKIQITVSEVARLREYEQIDPHSLETFEEPVVTDWQWPTPEQQAVRTLVRERVSLLVQQLDERQAEALRHYYGLDGREPCSSYWEVAERMKIHKDTASRYAQAGLASLRRRFGDELGEFRDFDLGLPGGLAA
jgi:RNA polymerase primary sigma factor